MTPRSVHEPAATSMLGDTLDESRRHFRKLVNSIDQLISEDCKEEARRHLPKLQSLGKELHRLLSPRDPVERKTRHKIDRDLQRVERELKESLKGAVGAGLIAVLLGSLLGVAALVGIFWMVFT